MSDTPRTDLNALTIETIRTLPGTGVQIVLAAVMRTMERDLNAANDRIEQLDKPITGETSDGYHSFNELYEHRHALFMALASITDSWMSKKHHDGSEMDGWFIAGTNLVPSVISYHMPMRLWDTCVKTGAEVLEKAPEWDGHTSKDVIERLVKYATL